MRPSTVDAHSNKPQTMEGPEVGPQCSAKFHLQNHLKKISVEAGVLENRILDLSRAVGSSEDDKGVSALRVQAAVLNAEVTALDTVLKANSGQASEQAVWSAIQTALKKQHRLELMALRTAAALSGHQISILSSSSEESNTSYASSQQSDSPSLHSESPPTISKIVVEAALSSVDGSTTPPSQSNDESSDSNAFVSKEVVNLSSDEEDSSEELEESYRVRSLVCSKPIAPGEVSVPLPCWATSPTRQAYPPSPTLDLTSEVAVPMPCWGAPPVSSVSVQVAPPYIEPPVVAFKAVLGTIIMDSDVDSLTQSDPAHDQTSPMDPALTVSQTPESTSEDISKLILQMVGIRKGHEAECASKFRHRNFFEFR